MKPKLKTSSLAAASLALLSASSHAAVIFTDDFTAAGTGNWYAGDIGTATLTNVSTNLQWAVGSITEKQELLGRSFTEQTLAVGETIRLTFDYTQTSNNVILRAGFADRSATAITAGDWALATTGTYGGYYSFVRDNLATGNSAREDAPGSIFSSSLTTTAPTYGSTGIDVGGLDTTTYNIDIVTTYQGLFDIKRTASGVETLFTLKSGLTTHFSIDGLDISGITTVFDTALLRIDTGTATFDNIQVSVIPEPRAALLGGLGLLVLLRRRRR